jgi:gas vesicle protein
MANQSNDIEPDKISQAVEEGLQEAAAQASDLAQQAGDHLEATGQAAQAQLAAATDEAAKALEEAQGAGADLVEQGSEQVKRAAEELRTVIESLTEGGGEQLDAVARQAMAGIDEAAKTAGNLLHGAADGLRDLAPAGAPAADFVSQVAGKLDETGDYLHEQGSHGLGARLTGWVARHPVWALLAVVGFIFVLRRIRRR